MNEKTKSHLDPVHPGEILQIDFIEPLSVTQNRIAVAIGVPPRRINEIVHGKRRISADTALRLSKYFGNSAEFWLNIQARYDLDLARDKAADEIGQIKPLPREGRAAA